MIACSAATSSKLSSSKLQTLRGGGPVDTDTLSKVMSGLSIATGAFAFAYPKENLEQYGLDPKEFNAETSHYMRLLALGQIVNGATLVAAETDADKASNTALTGSALLLLAAIPGFESQGVPKAPIMAWVAVLTALGKMAREGNIDSSLAAKLAGGFQVVTSVQEILKPDLTFDTYKMPKPKGISKMLFNGFVWNKLGNGLFVLIGKKTGNKALALAASLAAASANIVKSLVLKEDEEAGVKREGLIAWGVIQGVIAALAFKNAQE
jgi:hypothetical protein